MIHQCSGKNLGFLLSKAKSKKELRFRAALSMVEGEEIGYYLLVFKNRNFRQDLSLFQKQI